MSYLPNGMDGSIVATKTAVATPAEVFAGASALAGRSRLRITNLSEETRLRIGAAAVNLQRDGAPVEPGDSVTLHPSEEVYACSEGVPILIQVEEK